ncbi:MAG: hypothetical protein ACYTG0_13000, partial [Planctomycetota bacterium]
MKVFSLLDAIGFHCTTISPSLSWVRFVGIPFVGTGIIVRIVSRLTLGRQFSVHVQTSEQHRLVTTGIYA